ncbi:MAG: rod shape-determining protein MreC [Ruminococcus sp.]|jgi:rod shape-determining protein MreC|nr:rod shape-determining protein MreC [Ruminococcus sp.]
MREFFKSKKFKILTALMAVIVGIMIFTLTTDGYVPNISAFFSYISKPFQNLSTSVSNGFSDYLDTLVNASENKAENIQLQEQINELYAQMRDYELLLRENEELRTLLDLQKKYDDIRFSPPCSVIARTVGDPYESFTIDRGSDDGIAPYDPVVTSDGLIGLCVDVAATTSRVQTLYSPRTNVGVISARSLVKGIIEGGYEYINKKSVKMSYIDKAADIKIGDLVMTEGSEMYPPNQLAGIITEIVMETNGLSKYAIIELIVPPDSVTDVFVITDFNGQAQNE